MAALTAYKWIQKACVYLVSGLRGLFHLLPLQIFPPQARFCLFGWWGFLLSFVTHSAIDEIRCSSHPRNKVLTGFRRQTTWLYLTNMVCDLDQQDQIMMQE